MGIASVIQVDARLKLRVCCETTALGMSVYIAWVLRADQQMLHGEGHILWNWQEYDVSVYFMFCSK